MNECMDGWISWTGFDWKLAGMKKCVDTDSFSNSVATCVFQKKKKILYKKIYYKNYFSKCILRKKPLIKAYSYQDHMCP